MVLGFYQVGEGGDCTSFIFIWDLLCVLTHMTVSKFHNFSNAYRNYKTCGAFYIHNKNKNVKCE